ncbi:hypothetical protein QQ045_026666 [Rhodiola kirilowii]
MEENSTWDYWVEEALLKLDSLKLTRSLRPVQFSNAESGQLRPEEFEVFDGLRKWDRASVEVDITDATFRKWVLDIPSSGDEVVEKSRPTDDNLSVSPQQSLSHKLLLFSSNDYLGLSSHPTIGKAAAKAALEHGMGPRGSALICGYTNYHRQLESCLAVLKKKEDCLLCPTGFSANMAVMVTLGNLASLVASDVKPLKDEKVAIFSDALNHASIIDGIRLADQRRGVEVFIYKHCDMNHLNKLLLNCKLKKKVVVSDSLFSMDGDFAPMTELTKLRRLHGFLLVLDDAHGTFVCGKNGGGVAEQFNCEADVDICVGTLSKAAGCHGGFITCSKRWKQLIQSRGRAFIFSTATTIPNAAAAQAAVIVARRETWRRKALWKRVQDFQTLTGIPVASPIISLIVGSEEKALQASRHLLISGFHVTAIRPPTVPPNSCRLRVTLSAAHTLADLKKLVSALSDTINFKDIAINGSTTGYAKL